MKPTRFALALLCGVVLCCGLAYADSKDQLREKVDTAIAEGIRLLEAKEFATFLKSFVPPDEFKKVSEMGIPLEEFAKKFGETNAPKLLEVLKAVKGAKPAMSEDGNTAAFELKEPVAGKKSINFKKIGKYWYIRN